MILIPLSAEMHQEADKLEEDDPKAFGPAGSNAQVYSLLWVGIGIATAGGHALSGVMYEKTTWAAMTLTLMLICLLGRGRVILYTENRRQGAIALSHDRILGALTTVAPFYIDSLEGTPKVDLGVDNSDGSGVQGLYGYSDRWTQYKCESVHLLGRSGLARLAGARLLSSTCPSDRAELLVGQLSILVHKPLPNITITSHNHWILVFGLNKCGVSQTHQANDI